MSTVQSTWTERRSSGHQSWTRLYSESFTGWRWFSSITEAFNLLFVSLSLSHFFLSICLNPATTILDTVPSSPKKFTLRSPEDSVICPFICSTQETLLRILFWVKLPSGEKISKTWVGRIIGYPFKLLMTTLKLRARFMFLWRWIMLLIQGQAWHQTSCPCGECLVSQSTHLWNHVQVNKC